MAQNMNNYGHWEIPHEFDENSNYGFVYLIENTISGKKYIGQKKFAALCYKWQSYTSSSIPLNNDIRVYGKDKFKFKILIICKTSKDLNESEKSTQLEHDVLNSRLPSGELLYYNKYVHNVKFNLDEAEYGCRGKTISASRKLNKALRESFNHSIIYEYTNKKTKEVMTCSAKEFSKITGITITDCIKLSLGIRKLINNWCLTQNGVRLYCANMDYTIYNLKNVITGETVTGTQSTIIRVTGICSSILSTMINSDKKYSSNWVFCDSHWNLLSNTVDKRKSVTGNEHHLSDKTTYTIYNFNSKEMFSGTRADICKKLNINSDLCSCLVNNNIKICKNEWIVYTGKDYPPTYNYAGKSGITNNNADKTIYTVQNIVDNTICTGNRAEIRKTTGINVQDCVYIIRYNKIVKNWKYVGKA